MSVQAGIWNFNGTAVDQDLVGKLSQSMSKAGSDGQNIHFDGPIGMVYRPFHTTAESRREHQPHVSTRSVITLDGRLDNRIDLISQLHLSDFDTDVSIVAKAFECWGTKCFAKLIGDWAITVCDLINKELIFAKDYIGIRHLYFHITPTRVAWCTQLDPLVLCSGDSLTINDSYIAGYLAYYPEVAETPYREIQSVPAGSFTVLRNHQAKTCTFWSFPSRMIRYKTDREYEDHFRCLFRKAVQRRLRSDLPVLAQLSGGIDSSSIVCVADSVVDSGGAETPRVDTLSLYDPREPMGDERSFVSKIEQKRGRRGHHVDIGAYDYSFSLGFDRFYAVPGASGRMERAQSALSDLIRSHGFRVILSGTGGDELLGGVTNPCPQLADSIVTLRPIKLMQDLVSWGLVKREPVIHLLAQAVTLLLPLRVRALLSQKTKVVPWITKAFARRHNLLTKKLGPQGTFGFWRPSRREYAQTVIALRQQLAYSPSLARESEEKRYPYLDQTLVEFLASIPANQLLRPGHRRSLMRRALSDIVPHEVLNRRTKGGVGRSILVGIEENWKQFEEIFKSGLASRLGYFDATLLCGSLGAARHGNIQHTLQLLRAIYLEVWLRSVAESKSIDLFKTESRSGYDLAVQEA